MNVTPTESEIQYLRNALDQYNQERVGHDGHTPIRLVEYNERGDIVGGLLGGTYWGWMYVDLLWVHQDHRNQGIGSRLLRTAEAEALCRGCHHVHLDTMSWQAPEFYAKHGYEIIGILPDIPTGHQKYLLIKALSAEN